MKLVKGMTTTFTVRRIWSSLVMVCMSLADITQWLGYWRLYKHWHYIAGKFLQVSFK